MLGAAQELGEAWAGLCAGASGVALPLACGLLASSAVRLATSLGTFVAVTPGSRQEPVTALKQLPPPPTVSFSEELSSLAASTELTSRGWNLTVPSWNSSHLSSQQLWARSWGPRLIP